MTKTFITGLLLAGFAAATAHAQSPAPAEPDIVGVRLSTKPADLVPALHKQFPKMKSEWDDYTLSAGATEVHFRHSFHATLEVHLAPNERQMPVGQSHFYANILSDNTVVGLRRDVTFNPVRQTVQPLVDSLIAKYGQPVFNNYGGDQAMITLLWSDRMAPGLRNANAPATSSIGATPYYKCEVALAQYAAPSYNAKDLYVSLLSPGTQGYQTLQQAKECGTVVEAQISPASQSNAYANSLTVTVANLTDAADHIARLGNELVTRDAQNTAKKQKADAKNAPKL